MLVLSDQEPIPPSGVGVLRPSSSPFQGVQGSFLDQTFLKQSKLFLISAILRVAFGTLVGRLPLAGFRRGT